jgi:predicted nucleic acid-binding protein
MAAAVLVDAGFIVALLSRRDTHHRWATSQAKRFNPPWRTCEAVLSEAFHLLGTPGQPVLVTLLRRAAIVPALDLTDNLDSVLRLLEKYSNVPMGLADACLVRMTELLTDPIVLTTDADFHVYRRHGRQVVPCLLPSR